MVVSCVTVQFTVCVCSASRVQVLVAVAVVPFQLNVAAPQLWFNAAMSGTSFVGLYVVPSIVKVAVYLVVPTPVQVAPVRVDEVIVPPATVAVALTVWLESRLQVLVPVTLEPSAAQTYVGVP